MGSREPAAPAGRGVEENSAHPNGNRRPTAGSVPAVHRAARILGLLAQGGPHTLAGLADELALAKSTISDVCGALVAQQLARRDDDGRYWLGGHLESLAATWVGGEAILRRFVRECARVHALDGHTVTLHALHGAQTMCLEVRLGTRPLPLTPRPGTRGALASTAAGRAILRAMPVDRLRETLRRAAGFDGLDGKEQADLVADALRRDESGGRGEPGPDVVEISVAFAAGPLDAAWTAVTAVVPVSTATAPELAGVRAGVELLAGALSTSSTAPTDRM